MRLSTRRLVLAGAISAVLCGPAAAGGPSWGTGGNSFDRIASFANYTNNGPANIGDETVSEIVAATADGNTLVYTDSERETVGIVDITDPANPSPLGVVAVDGEPTSVAVKGNDLALVAVNTSVSFTDTSGKLVVVDIVNKTVIHSIELGGQPDAVSLSPDGDFLAIAIEEERDEEICVGGGNSGMPVPEDDEVAETACEDAGGEIGIIPQTAGSPLDTNGNLNNPPGWLAIVDIMGSDPAGWGLRTVDLTGIAHVAPSDPEPEFVDVNASNEAVVTLQENNHIVLVDLPTGEIIGDFSAGDVDLKGIDTKEEDVISLDSRLNDVPREPDAVTWVRTGNVERIATANEGDMFGGSRGFSIFGRNGSVVFDTGNKFEELAVRHGHYPEDRSKNKGSEPEAITFARINGTDYLFVGSERGSFVAVYTLNRGGHPEFAQLLAGPLGPEGLLPIPERNLLVASGEVDDPTFGVRSTMMIYELKEGEPAYPQLVSAEERGKPIPWSALSGMDALPGGDLVAVWDSFYAESNIFRIDASSHPAVVTEALTISGGSGNFDPEGIALAPDGSYWIASEGNRTGSRLNRLLQVDPASGAVMREVFLPAEIEACRQAERDANGTIGSHNGGFEGVAVAADEGGYRLLVAQQRGWNYSTTSDCEALDDDPDDSNPSEPGWTRIWTFDPHETDPAMQWDSIPYELASVPATASWVGLSEITAVGDGSYVLIERDNRTGDFTDLKTLVRVDGADMADGVTAGDKSVHDLIPALESTNGWITDKPEGVAINEDGETYLVTDNDGVDDWSGETTFLNLGDVEDLF